MDWRRDFKNFEGKPLNKEFIDFLKIWESNMVLRLKDLSGKDKETSETGDKFYEMENL